MSTDDRDTNSRDTNTRDTHDGDTEATSPIDVPEEDTMTTPTTSGADTAQQFQDTVPPTPAAPTVPAAATTPEAPRRGPRVGTIVWGLVIAAVGAFILAYALGLEFDEELAFIIVIAAAGVLLLVGSVMTSRRRRT